MDNLTVEDKIKLSKQAVDSFVENFGNEEADKKFVLAFFALLLGRESPPERSEPQ